ncbi:hypothetical protein RGUI_0243 [Rhodovulum sp. P5]|uniref:hypothetical protein n=1 Tax=Rhodovulum sp. P5 TaxID=1564506 RepID=UPI0009C1EAFC|nr:hypothetical protein [Rhodovulum sp. P5]ARE38384.1 hypothetical protein RGUI_0243 [Rhodovulum sp. P5]
MGRPPMFLARQGYRRRRLADVSRLLPILGLALFLFPVLDAEDGLTAAMLLYLFAAWFGLIVISLFVARRLCADGERCDDPDGTEGQG